MGHHHLPVAMRRRLREYMHQQRTGMLLSFSQQALPLLSPGLQVEVVLHCHRFWIEKVWFLGKVEQVCVVRVALAMRPRTFAPNDIAPQRSLYVVHRGIVVFGSRVLSRGMSWGDDVILSDPRYALPFLARAMTYVDVGMLDRNSLVSILSDYPTSKENVRRATILLALRRHIVNIAREERTAQHNASLKSRASRASREGSSGGPPEEENEEDEEGEGGGALGMLDFVTRVKDDGTSLVNGNAADGQLSRHELAAAVVALDGVNSADPGPPGMSAHGGSGGGVELTAIMESLASLRSEMAGVRKAMDARMSSMQEAMETRMSSLEDLMHEAKGARTLPPIPAVTRSGQDGQAQIAPAPAAQGA